MNKTLLVGAQVLITPDLSGHRQRFLIYQRTIFAPPETWMDALTVPQHMQARFQSRMELSAINLSETGMLMAGLHNGSRVYRVHCTLDALECWYHAYLRGVRQKEVTPNQLEQEKELARRFYKLRTWLWTTAEQAIIDRLTQDEGPTLQPAPPQLLEDMVDKLEGLTRIAGNIVRDTGETRRDVKEVCRQQVVMLAEVRRARGKRTEISHADKGRHRHVLNKLGNRCPFCHQETSHPEFDHFYENQRAEFEATWPLCDDCHADLTYGRRTRTDAETQFHAYQKFAAEVLPMQGKLL